MHPRIDAAVADAAAAATTVTIITKTITAIFSSVHRNFQCSVNCLPYGCTFSPLRLVPSKILNYVRRHRHRLFNLPIMQSNVDQGMIAIHYIVFVVTLSVACAMAHHAFTMGPFICCLFFLYLSQTV